MLRQGRIDLKTSGYINLLFILTWSLQVYDASRWTTKAKFMHDISYLGSPYEKEIFET